MESNAESAETCHRKVATSTLKVATSSQKMATFMLKVASDIYKTPLYRTAHSPENFSDEWAFFFPCIKFTFVVTQIATKSWIKNHLIFSKILEVRGTKMKKIQKNYELNAGESFRLDKNGLHGVTAQGRIKMSLLLVFE